MPRQAGRSHFLRIEQVRWSYENPPERFQSLHITESTSAKSNNSLITVDFTQAAPRSGGRRYTTRFYLSSDRPGGQDARPVPMSLFCQVSHQGHALFRRRQEALDVAAIDRPDGADAERAADLHLAGVDREAPPLQFVIEPLE